jgi:hypothetical protein
MTMIDEQIVRRHRELWPGRISTDAEFKSRLERIAERRSVQAIDREITTKLIDALIGAGYVITCCVRDDEPEFRRSVDRAGILDMLFDLDMAELHVHRDGKRSWIMLIFGEGGFDVVADYSVGLEGLIEPLVESYGRAQRMAIVATRSSRCRRLPTSNVATLQRRRHFMVSFGPWMVLDEGAFARKNVEIDA